MDYEAVTQLRVGGSAWKRLVIDEPQAAVRAAVVAAGGLGIWVFVVLLQHCNAGRKEVGAKEAKQESMRLKEVAERFKRLAVPGTLASPTWLDPSYQPNKLLL